MQDAAYREAYKSLNTNQKQAVDTIDGPLMVIAGPGTGKTQLLSMRVANILKTTDTLPASILCLTYTEAGARSMRERMSQLMGLAGQKVTVHTFHGFASSIMSQNADYFYDGAENELADGLTSYQILESIFDALPKKSLLASKNEGVFTYLKTAQRVISDVKKAGLSYESLVAINQDNVNFAHHVQPAIREYFPARISKSVATALPTILSTAETYTADTTVPHPLRDMFITSLETALDEMNDQNSTKPITAWKNQWLAKDSRSEFVLSDLKTSEKMLEFAEVYREYVASMQRQQLYDYDDMILRVIYACEQNPDLLANLQEQFLYIMVDEYQDTNDSQLRLLRLITDHPSLNGRPNLMVVGDDDQAIFRFQGANISNIKDLLTLYPDTQTVTLIDNYRSTDPILQLSRQTITQGVDRLESAMGLNKTLVPHQSGSISPVSLTYSTPDDQYHAVARDISAQISTDPNRSIAIIGRNHAQLTAIVPHLQAVNVPLTYELQSDAMQNAVVQQLLLASQCITAIGRSEFEELVDLLPGLLAHPAWGIEPEEIIQLSLRAYKNHSYWLEEMLQYGGRIQEVAAWLVVMSQYSLIEPLAASLDRLIGLEHHDITRQADDQSEPFVDGPVEGTFVSPLRSHYFTRELLDEKPYEYIDHLRALNALRRAVANHFRDQDVHLEDFVSFIEDYQSYGAKISYHVESVVRGGVELMTAHSSKGREFDVVYIIDAHEKLWGPSANERANILKHPVNIPLDNSSSSHDERLRLLYVALTRAKHQLIITRPASDHNGRATESIAWLNDLEPQAITHDAPTIVSSLETTWRQNIQQTANAIDLRTVLSEQLERYRLSASHITSYLNLSYGGPEAFLLDKLLHFPSSESSSIIYGNAIHEALRSAHHHFQSNNQPKPVEDVIKAFETQLQRSHLSQSEIEQLSQSGASALSAYMSLPDVFRPNQQSEADFSGDNIVVDGVRLTGKIDLMRIDETTKTITVIDYKSANPIYAWDRGKPYEQIKAHQYRQQLLFYKLLIEQSPRFRDYQVTDGSIIFINPDRSGDIIQLDTSFTNDEMTDFKDLLSAVWKSIQNLDFPDTSEYSNTAKGISQFESDIIDKYL